VPRPRSTFLAAVVLVVPLFKSVKASPVLGFLFAGAAPLLPRRCAAAAPPPLRSRRRCG
jgi:hypothetical protein